MVKVVRKYFGTDGIRGKANIFPMTSDFALKLGLAIAKIIKKTNGKHNVVIGKDTRISCYMLESALTAGLTAGGVDEVFMIGPIPTPGIAMLTRSMRCDLGIMISASHNPYYDNGIKLFDSNGVKFPDTIEQEIEAVIDSDGLMENLPIENKLGRAWRSDNYIYQQRYIEFIKSTFPKKMNLNGIKLVLDCANGASYKVAPTVFWELGANVIRIGCEPSGININDNCGSTKPQMLQKRVLSEKADLGIALDGDADRIIIVDEKGEIVDGDKIIALITKKMLNKNELKNNTVVITQMSNLGLELYLKNLGINTVRTKVGDRYIIEEMRKNDYNLGGEQSGHIILGDYSTTGDGICTGLQVLACLQFARENNKNATISDLLNLYENIPQKLENVKFDKEKGNPLELEEVRKTIDECEKELKNVGRILVRKSGTEPLLRVMVECRDERLLDKMLNKVCDKIKENI